ncbi:pyridoxamine 5'-phosphate oxidase family protein [Microbacterium sp. ZW T2_14]|uniref:pyridoxamine 5'-phosphate oxidase family protein n=1 Tax=Microbacterium sp. ZW T2_14 TaxID=3378079 RepID=UPI003854920F
MDDSRSGGRETDTAAASAAEEAAPGAPAQVERLPTSECWTLLQEARLGRLAVIHADGAPDVFPVNFTSYEGSLFVRTARDAKLLHIAQHPLVAFEVDGDTADSLWSVVVRGRAARVTSDDELRRSGVRELESWSPTRKLFAIKITASTVTGRRFPKRSGRADPLIPFEGRVRAEAPPEPPHRSRGDSPQQIPHHGPRPATAPHPVDAGGDHDD